jgi:flagellar basal body rod protein FlgG
MKNSLFFLIKRSLVFILYLLIHTAIIAYTIDSNNPYYIHLPDDGTREMATSADAFREQYLKSVDYTFNSATPGFIRKTVTNTRAYNHPEGKHIVVADYTYRWIDLGTPMETGNPLDLVVDGGNKAFFTVQMDKNILAYTRDGRFRVDFENRLVTLSGNYPVLGKNGIITIENQRDIEFTASGGVYVDGNLVDYLVITVFENFEDMNRYLHNLNGSFFTLTKQVPVLEGPEHYKVYQYQIKQSNAFQSHESWMIQRAHQGTVNSAFKLIEMNQLFYNSQNN